MRLSEQTQPLASQPLPSAFGAEPGLGNGPAVRVRRPWEVARWGRLLAGGLVLLFTALALLHHSGWLALTLGVGFNLVMTAITDKCPLRSLLVRWGGKEREDLFLPGGAPRTPARF